VKIFIIFSVLFSSLATYASGATTMIPLVTDGGDGIGDGITRCYYSKTLEVGPADQHIGKYYWIRPIAERYVVSSQTTPSVTNGVLFLTVLTVTQATHEYREDLCLPYIFGEITAQP
jgi:hypothetical protein